MFKPSDTCSPLRLVVVLTLLSPLMAWPIVTTIEGTGPAEASDSTELAAPAASLRRPQAPVAPAKVAGGYQIRCWQYGRLLFEENHVALPDMARYGLRIGGTDATGRPLYVADTQHATCLIRAAVEERAWPR
jgi:hypothetical protein